MDEIKTVIERLQELEAHKERLVMLLPDDQAYYAKKIIETEGHIIAAKKMIARLSGAEFDPFH